MALVIAALGVFVGYRGLLGWRGRLSKDRGPGLRTTASLSSEAAFQVANKVAGLPTMVGGTIALAGGVASLFMPTTVGLLLACGLALAGMVALVLGGSALGHRAALAVPVPPAPPVPPVPSCGGCACGAGGCGA